MTILVWLLVFGVLGLSGCAHALGYAGKNPGGVECYGKATITGSGQGVIGIGYAGTEVNAYTITFDCGDKAGIRQYNPQDPPTMPLK